MPFFGEMTLGHFICPNIFTVSKSQLMNPNLHGAKMSSNGLTTGNLLEFGITSSYYNFPHPYAGRPRDFALIQKNHNPLAACAACSAIKRSLFIDVGGFDEKLVHSYSDIDLCLRLRDRQYKTVCVARSEERRVGKECRL